MSKEKKFEENLADLEVIVQKLENGDVALEEAISNFCTITSKSAKFSSNFFSFDIFYLNFYLTISHQNG